MEYHAITVISIPRCFSQTNPSVPNVFGQVPTGITGESWSTRSRSLLLDDKAPVVGSIQYAGMVTVIIIWVYINLESTRYVLYMID